MAQSKNGDSAEVEFNQINQQMLMDYETYLFDSPPRGGVNRVVHDIKAAVKAGWIGEPFDGFNSGAWLKEEPDPVKIQLLSETDKAVDAKYSSFIIIDPSG